MAKNVKKKDLVFALLNREVIEAMWGELIHLNDRMTDIALDQSLIRVCIHRS